MKSIICFQCEKESRDQSMVMLMVDPNNPVISVGMCANGHKLNAAEIRIILAISTTEVGAISEDAARRAMEWKNPYDTSMHDVGG